MNADLQLKNPQDLKVFKQKSHVQAALNRPFYKKYLHSFSFLTFLFPF